MTASRPVAIDRAVLLDALRIARGDEPVLFTIDEVLQVLAITLLLHELEAGPRD